VFVDLNQNRYCSTLSSTRPSHKRREGSTEVLDQHPNPTQSITYISVETFVRVVFKVCLVRRILPDFVPSVRTVHQAFSKSQQRYGSEFLVWI
jgi:hypothetical protein